MKRVPAVVTVMMLGLSSAALALPGATGVTPAQSSTVSTKPSFTWTPVGGATWYRVWGNPTGAGANQLFCTDPFYGAGRVDPHGCWVQGGTTHVQTQDLTAGSWRWFVHAWSDTARGADWSPGIDFTVVGGATQSVGSARAAIHVAPDGTVSRYWNPSGGAPTVFHTSGDNTYIVKFPGFSSVHSSFFTGVTGAANSGTSNGIVTIVPFAGTQDSLYVNTYSVTGASAERGFYILIH